MNAVHEQNVDQVIADFIEALDAGNAPVPIRRDGQELDISVKAGILPFFPLE